MMLRPNAWMMMLVVALLATMGYAQPAEVAERMETQRKAYARSDGRLGIDIIHLPDRPIAAFSRLQVDFALAGDYTNPFDPDEIAVDALITRPDGRTATVPAFFQTPLTPLNGLTQMAPDMDFRPDGQSGWRLRFTPEIPGDYRLRLIARDRQGRTVESAEQAFAVEPAPHKGFVRVSANPLYFENSGDGSLFWATGANVAWTRTTEQQRGAKGTPSYEHYFSRAAGKMSATRVWLCHWAWLEWTPLQPANIWPGYAGAGHYNQMIATQVDRIFDLAEAQGLRIMLVTEDNDELSHRGPAAARWESHPYNKANGGPCENPPDIFVDPEARRLYRNRLRYIIARWGYSPSLWAINSMNDHHNPNASHLAWLKEVHGYVHSLVENHRPLIYGTNLSFAANEIVDYRQAANGPVTPDKPNVVQEAYYTAVPESFRQELHEQLWAGLGRGLGGIMVWDHVLVDRTDAWDEFQPLLAFIADLPLHRHAWQPAQARITSAAADGPGPFPRATEMRYYGDVPEWGVKSPNNRFEFDLTRAQQWMEGFGPTLWGDRPDRAQWANPPVIQVDMPADGKLLVEVREVGSDTNRLIVSGRTGDDQPWQHVRTITYENGRRSTTTEEQWLEIPLSRGPQQVRLEATGDWVRINRIVASYPMADAASLANLSGWTDGRHAMLYLQNQSHSRLLGEVLKQPPLKLSDLQLEVSGLDDGRYRIDYCATSTGAPTASFDATSRDGRLTIALPDLQRDAAIRIVPAP